MCIIQQMMDLRMKGLDKMNKEKEKNFDKNNENCVEWLTGEKTVFCTFTNKRDINRMKKLYEKRPADFSYFHENSDGSICCKVPRTWQNVRPPREVKREYTDEEKAKRVENLKLGREKRKLLAESK